MSDKAAAAQKWAEAKDAAELARAAFEAAQTALIAASDAEQEAWEALETLAGRIPPSQPPRVPVSLTATGAATAGGTWGPPRNHDLPIRPLG